MTREFDLAECVHMPMTSYEIDIVLGFMSDICENKKVGFMSSGFPSIMFHGESAHIVKNETCRIQLYKDVLVLGLP